MCLHKFCGPCIENYNRTIKKQCPSCRINIGSRRLLRSDYKLAYIINALIKDIDAFNKFEEEERGKEILNKFDFTGFREKMKKKQKEQKRKALAADMKHDKHHDRRSDISSPMTKIQIHTKHRS